MEGVVSQASAAKLPAAHVAFLTMVVENTKASHFEVIDKNYAEARQHYRKAYDICNQSESAKAGLSRTVGR